MPGGRAGIGVIGGELADSAGTPSSHPPCLQVRLSLPTGAKVQVHDPTAAPLAWELHGRTFGLPSVFRYQGRKRPKGS